MAAIVRVTFRLGLWTLVSCSQAHEALQGQQAQPQPTVDLQVKVNGRVIGEEDFIPLNLGESVQLEVELRRRDGTVTDVTRHPKTRYVSVAPWILSVSDKGLVTASPSLMARFLMEPKNEDIGALTISYGPDERGDFGARMVGFEIRNEEAFESGRALYVIAPKSTLGVGETVQLKVIQKVPGGEPRDLTAAETGTVYRTSDGAKLIPEPDGRVTCVGTRGRPEAQALISVRNGNVSGSKSFRLVSEGPGPSLEIIAEKTVLEEGEQTQLRVYRRGPAGVREDVTAPSTGTKYLAFAGHGRPEPNVITLEENGRLMAPSSIGRLNWLEVILFARNGNSVGWIEIRVVPRRKRQDRRD